MTKGRNQIFKKIEFIYMVMIALPTYLRKMQSHFVFWPSMFIFFLCFLLWFITILMLFLANQISLKQVDLHMQAIRWTDKMKIESCNFIYPFLWPNNWTLMFCLGVILPGWTVVMLDTALPQLLCCANSLFRDKVYKGNLHNGSDKYQK